MEALIPIIIQAISGMVGGGLVGTIVKQAAMAMLPKLLAGGLGGIGGGMALGPLIAGMLGGDAGGAMDMGSILGNVVGGAAGGGALTAIAGMVLGKK